MLNAYARRPAFGMPVCSDEYYQRVDAIIATLRETASRSVIAAHLNRCGFLLRGAYPSTASGWGTTFAVPKFNY